MTLRRYRLSRARGSRMPPDTVKVDRSTRWGNPHTFGNSGAVHPVVRFACETGPLWDVTPLAGKSLACWCYLCPQHQTGLPIGTECAECAPCHADVLLELANPSSAAE